MDVPAALVRRGLWAILPTLDAAEGLTETLAALALPASRIVVADGGSADRTRDIAGVAGAHVVDAPRGRGTQLAAGAAFALDRGAGWLLFVHADTRLAPDWPHAAATFIEANPMGDRAAYLRLAFDDPDRRAARVARLANWRARTFGLPYGDQGLLVPADLYRATGGYRTLPLMEDVDLVRRIGRARLVELQTVATTSSARYRRDGWLRRPARNLACLALWFAGVPPERLVGFYRGRR
jgi:rSAM/selenodomain-associated transferase 2